MFNHDCTFAVQLHNAFGINISQALQKYEQKKKLRSVIFRPGIVFNVVLSSKRVLYFRNCLSSL